jgi:quinol-cytochrome oxidoreductase complex cytochrome b subunit
MASTYKINYLKRTIAGEERQLNIPLWKYFLIMALICITTYGGLVLLMDYKSDVDIASTPYIAMLLFSTILQAVVWTAVLRYFGKKHLKKLRKELDTIEGTESD